jgi:hypothetical protein
MPSVYADSFYFQNMMLVSADLSGQSIEWICSHSLAGIVGSNPAGGMDLFFL